MSTNDFETLRSAVLAMPMARTLKFAFQRVESGDVELEMPAQEAWALRPAGFRRRRCS